MAQLKRLARLGRAAGITVVAVTQRPSAAALGGLDARTQMTTRIALGVTEARDGELILGTGRVGVGWRAERLTKPGYFLALVLGVYDQPRPARAYLVDDAAVRAVVARTATQRPSLDPESAERCRPAPGAAQGHARRARACGPGAAGRAGRRPTGRPVGR
jgi:DNA segregation ATPase FtsK/SpoIIIE-like protein